MTVYTVHEPPPGKRGGKPAPERIQFVRDGFYFWAFLLGPLWMLWRRLWLVLVIYLAAAGVIQIALWAADVPGAVKFAVGVLFALLIGFEAGSLRRWTLSRWRERGIVVAPNLEMAERRFFEAWPTYDSSPQPPSQPAPQAAAMRVPTSDADVIGLFPDPAPRR